MQHMAIYLIVDGYNLIGVKGTMGRDLEAQRSRLIMSLTRYHEIKGYPIIVVFDGWGSDGSGANEQAFGAGVRVIFSRHGEKADAVIKRLALKLKSGCVVVSSDREVARYAESNNAVAVPAGEFDRRLHAALQSVSDGENEEPEPSPAVKRGNPRRLSKIERKRQRKLGRL
jgi:predicted RNA-binding protein with PIN domain